MKNRIGAIVGFVLCAVSYAAVPNEDKETSGPQLIPPNYRLYFLDVTIGAKPAMLLLQNLQSHGEINLQLTLNEGDYSHKIAFDDVQVTAKCSSGNAVKIVPKADGLLRSVYINGKTRGQLAEYNLQFGKGETLESITVKWNGDERTFIMSKGSLEPPPPITWSVDVHK